MSLFSAGSISLESTFKAVLNLGVESNLLQHY